uniref:N-alpha-acetyltransferase 40, NatD catalytic subunit n=1 Tax=Equus caballus TaxID=9796 RepID=A0A9L0SI57_HORSE
MGRKSSKAKEKKQKRLEERAAMDAVCAKVDAANRLGDPLEAFPVFKKYDRNGLNVSIECKRVSGLEPATVDWAFDLTKTNMQTMYEQSEWGWKDREKREEMTDDRAWYLIAWESSSVPVAFSHFRFDVECGDEVLYCYEVQLESKVRRKGLGKFPDFSAAGLLTSTHTCTHLDKWSVYSHLYESPGALGRGLAGPQRETDSV